MILGQTYDEQLFKSDIFRLFINTFANGQNGIINGYKQSCNLSNTQSTITIADGVILLQGGFIQIQGNETLTVDLDNTCCILAFEIDLTKENTETQFEQGKFKIIKGTASTYPTLQQDDIANNSTGIYQMEFARFIAGAGGISNFVDNRVFINFETLYELIEQQGNTMIAELDAEATTLIESINEQANQTISNIETEGNALIQELEEKTEQAGNLPIDEDTYNSSDSDGNSFTIYCRRQGSIVSIHIKATLVSGAFGNKLKSQLGFPNNTFPDKYKPRENLNDRRDYTASSGTENKALGYLAVTINENAFTLQISNRDSQSILLEINLMYFGKAV